MRWHTLNSTHGAELRQMLHSCPPGLGTGRGVKETMPKWRLFSRSQATSAKKRDRKQIRQHTHEHKREKKYHEIKKKNYESVPNIMRSREISRTLRNMPMSVYKHVDNKTIKEKSRTSKNASRNANGRKGRRPLYYQLKRHLCVRFLCRKEHFQSRQPSCSSFYT